MSVIEFIVKFMMVDIQDSGMVVKNLVKCCCVLIIVVGIFVFIVVGWLLFWLLVLFCCEKIDNVYVGGNQVVILVQVLGIVVVIMVDDMQWVEVGQVLVKFDGIDVDVCLQQVCSVLVQVVCGVCQQIDSVIGVEVQVVVC